MKLKTTIIILVSFLLTTIFYSCEKEVIPPVVVTGFSNNVTSNSALLNGQILSDGGGKIKERGFLIGTSKNLTLSDKAATSPGGVGQFSAEVTGLERATLYYYAAYATNSAGTIIGLPILLQTEVEAATVLTSLVKDITSNSALAMGKVVDDGGGFILSVGFCLSKTNNPTVNNLVFEGDMLLPPSLEGQYEAELSSLEQETKYYIRAFVDNGKVISYGEELSFTTEGLKVTDIQGNVYKAVKIGNQVWMAENLRVTKYNNGDAVTAIPFSTPWYDWPNNNIGYWSYAKENDPLTNIPYGKVYNWLAATDPRGLCPSGWHFPSADEWTTLIDFLGGVNSAGPKIMSTSGWVISGIGTNSSGLNVYPTSIEPSGFGKITFWKTSDQLDPTFRTGIGVVLGNDGSINIGIGSDPVIGAPVRCIKN